MDSNKGTIMPKLSMYECDSCKGLFHHGWGGHDYVIAENGERIVCPHPQEYQTIKKVLDLDNEEKFPKPKFWWSKKKKTALRESIDKFVKERTGFHSFCVCLDCKTGNDLDLKKDKRICPMCNSANIKSILELVGDVCPVCGNGNIIERDTGAIA